MAGTFNTLKKNIPMTKVIMRKTLMTSIRSFTYGRSYDLPEDQAKEFLSKGYAIPDKASTQKAETATTKKVAETAEAKPKSRTRTRKK